MKTQMPRNILKQWKMKKFDMVVAWEYREYQSGNSSEFIVHTMARWLRSFLDHSRWARRWAFPVRLTRTTYIELGEQGCATLERRIGLLSHETPLTPTNQLQFLPQWRSLKISFTNSWFLSQPSLLCRGVYRFLYFCDFFSNGKM
jgi:hypothetical protein